MHIIGLEFGHQEGFALEFKRIMQASVERAEEENPSISKKSIALDLGYTPADLSHWLSPKCPRSTMPAHLVPLFCHLTGDNTLLWLMQEAYEKPPTAMGA